MATTVKLTLRKSKTRSDGASPIYLRVTKDRKSRFISTGIYIAPRHWNADRQQVRRSHELAVAYNAKLHDLRLEAERPGPGCRHRPRRQTEARRHRRQFHALQPTVHRRP